METRKKMAKIFANKNLLGAKKDGKDFTSCQKRWQKFTKFAVFWGFRAYIGCFKGVGIGWAVFGSKRSTGCRDMRG